MKYKFLLRTSDFRLLLNLSKTMAELKNKHSQSYFKNIYIYLSSELEKHENYQYHSRRPLC
jgi:hypothetical protein